VTVTTIQQLLAEQVVRHPQAEAMRQGEQGLTYAELDRRTEQVAQHLLRCGLARQERVAWLATPTIDSLIAALAVFRAGGVLLPLDHHHPAARIQHVLRDATPRFLLTDQTTAEQYTNHVEVVPMTDLLAYSDAARTATHTKATHTKATHTEATHAEATHAEAALTEAALTEAPASSAELLYLIYTSGSTGTPKGVMATEEAVAAFLVWERETFQIGPGDRVAQLTSPAFEPFLRDLLLPLCAGATLCLPPAGVVQDRRQLLTWLTDERISLVHTVPSLCRQLTEAMAQDDTLRLPALRSLLLVGEALDTKTVRRFHALAPTVTVVNCYSPTEATMVKAYHIVRTDSLNRRTVPIGRAIPGAELLLLDEAGELDPTLDRGEIAIASPHLALGYWRDPARTEDVFRHAPPTRYLRTGDIGRRLPNGEFEYIGRRDEQLKIRGHRIAPSDIAAALTDYPAIREAVVLPRLRPDSEPEVLAFVAAAEAALAPTPLFQQLRKKLPAYMLPAQIHRFDTLPLLPNGKVDRQQLLQLATSCTHLLRGPYQPPFTPTEATLAELFARALGLARVGRDEDFFQLGGHSLVAMQLVDMIQQATGAQLTVRDLLLAPTVEALARHVEQISKIFPR